MVILCRFGFGFVLVQLPTNRIFRNNVFFVVFDALQATTITQCPLIFFFARGFCFRRKCHKHTHTQCTSTSLQRAVDIPDASLLLICWWFQSWPPDDDDDEKNLPGDKQKREKVKSGGKIIIKVSDYTGEFIYI